MRLKILHTQQLYFPKIGGSEEVIRQLSERLVKRGHEVTVATAFDPRRESRTLNGVRIQEFRLGGNSAIGIHGGSAEVLRYQRFIQDGDFDLVLNSCAQVWSTDLVFPLLPRLRCAKVLAASGYSGLHRPVFRRYFEDLPQILRQYDHVIYFSGSYQDKHFGDKHGIRHYSIIPNGANEDEFARDPLGFRQRYGVRTRYMLLTVGNHHAAKGHRFVIEAFRRLGRADITLVILGHPVRRGLAGCYLSCRLAGLHPRIRVLTVPRRWIVSAFQEADVFVFGSQIESAPLVIFEAMAAGIPFVSTDCGSVSDQKAYGLIVASPDEMARNVNTLLSDGQRRRELGAAAKEAWRARHTWETITDQYERVYTMLVQQTRALR